jgi:hypothetical protein
MNTVTVDRIRAAVKETGLQLVNRSWIMVDEETNEPCSLCALSQVLIGEKAATMDEYRGYMRVKPFSLQEFMVEKLGLEKDYVDGFLLGFDNRSLNLERIKGTAFEQGREDGNYARKELLPNA